MDDYSNNIPEAIARIEQISGTSVKAYEVDVKDKVVVMQIFEENEIDYIIYFAGLKTVGE